MDATKKYCKEAFSVKTLKRRFPIITWLPKYRLKHLQGDVIAGLTVGLTVLPQGLAYAQIAELPPQYGLYSAFMGCFVYTFLGTSKDITMGPTAIMSLMTADFGQTEWLPHNATNAIILTFFAGIIQMIMGFLHLGFIVQFISFPVINGFTSAASITIAFGQLKNLLGLKGIPRDFLHMVYETFRKIPETNIWDLVMGLCSMVILVILKFIKDLKYDDEEGVVLPMSTKVSRKILWLVGTARNAVVVVAAAGIAAALLAKDIDVLSLTGNIQEGLPPFKLPNFTLQISPNETIGTGQLFQNIGAGFAIIPLIGLLETIAIGKAFARKNDYSIEPNQELIAMGAANFLSSFVSSYPITGSFSRTAVNSASGVRTPAGGIFTGLLVVLALALLTPLFYYIPDAALAAVIITAVLDMFDWKIYLTLWRVKKLDIIPLFSTFIMSFILGIEYGILIGIGLSLMIVLYPMARPHVKMGSKDIMLVQPDQGLKFPGVEYVRDKIYTRALIGETPRSVVFDFTHVSGVDYTTVQLVERLYEDCKKHKVQIAFAGMRPEILEIVESAKIPEFAHFHTIEEAEQALSEEKKPLLARAHSSNATDERSATPSRYMSINRDIGSVGPHVIEIPEQMNGIDKSATSISPLV
ncbi:LOW QUALITY PROTEIN: sodium-independent sulfate anion transporter-like [Lingula anatina]|uniref:LOW QUALITY PROTEIN: sodium-independent sulfate anion transporter-like n=1 Tax=Lingula anatina TaxID=7574 RepID=A0A1S3JX49_LINAN|nr:LOW QUALITY PROTEIN: sodium-independent sulfate anion transporter-like [Lingula anatina]|eukprot:XP_013414887.1 LOW QUALITY PROTEIN: sodium-independent sulfate anion transporter-like [Lingula anatina]